MHAEGVGLSSFVLQKSSIQAVVGPHSGNLRSQRACDFSMTSPVAGTASKCVAKRVMDTWVTFLMVKILETLSINGGA